MVHATEDPEVVALRHVEIRASGCPPVSLQPNQCGLYANCGSGYLSAAAFEQHDVEGQQFVSTLAEACGVSE